MKQKTLGRLGRLIYIGPQVLFIFALLPTLKQPIIYDGNYIFIMAITVLFYTISALCMMFMYRTNSQPHFIFLYQLNTTPKKKLFFVLKAVLSFLSLMLVFAYLSTSLAYYFLKNDKLVPQKIDFKVKKVKRESWTKDKVNVLGYSFHHEDDIRIIVKRNQVLKSMVNECVILNTEGNEYGKIIKSISPAKSCP